MRILIADDGDASRMELESLLTRRSHDVVAVADGMQRSGAGRDNASELIRQADTANCFPANDGRNRATHHLDINASKR